MSSFTSLGGITVLQTLNMSNSDFVGYMDAAKQPTKKNLECEEMTFRDISDDAVLSTAICPVQLCGKILKNKTTLKRHIREKHAHNKETAISDIPAQSANKPTCSSCGKHFTRKSNMKNHMKKCNDSNSGGREENPRYLEQVPRKIEDVFFETIFESKGKYDMPPANGLNDGDLHNGAEAVEEGGDEVDGDLEEEDRDKNEGAGDERIEDVEDDEAGGEEDNIDQDNVNNIFGIEVKEEDRKELSWEESSLLSLLASGLATSATILSSLAPQMQVFNFFWQIFGWELVSIFLIHQLTRSIQIPF